MQYLVSRKTARSQFQSELLIVQFKKRLVFNRYFHFVYEVIRACYRRCAHRINYNKRIIAVNFRKHKFLHRFTCWNNYDTVDFLVIKSFVIMLPVINNWWSCWCDYNVRALRIAVCRITLISAFTSAKQLRDFCRLDSSVWPYSTKHFFDSPPNTQF